eukprot:14662000-Alexandrium_andersonii.AAC.1
MVASSCPLGWRSQRHGYRLRPRAAPSPPKPAARAPVGPDLANRRRPRPLRGPLALPRKTARGPTERARLVAALRCRG